MNFRVHTENWDSFAVLFNFENPDSYLKLVPAISNPYEGGSLLSSLYSAFDATAKDEIPAYSRLLRWEANQVWLS